MGDGLFAAEPKEWVSTGLTLLDAVLGGGLPVGRAVEIYGDSQSGKSLLGLHILSCALRQKCVVALQDTERASTRDFAQRMAGLDTTQVLYSEVRTLEEAYDAFEQLLGAVRSVSQAPLVVLIDSIAGLSTEREKDTEFSGKKGIAVAARLNYQAFRKFIDRIAEERVILIGTNQTRVNVGAMPWEEKTTTYGGGAWGFFSSVRLALRLCGKIKSDEADAPGVWVEATVKKNRMDPPGRKVRFPVYYTTGIDDLESLVEFLYQRGALGSAKGWIVFGEKKYRRQAFLEAARSEPTLREAVKLQALATLRASGQLEDGADEGLIGEEM